MSLNQAIPQVNAADPKSLKRHCDAVRQTLNQVTGADKKLILTKLDPTTATTAQIATLLNEVVDRLNGTP